MPPFGVPLLLPLLIEPTSCGLLFRLLPPALRRVETVELADPFAVERLVLGLSVPAAPQPDLVELVGARPRMH